MGFLPNLYSALTVFKVGTCVPTLRTSQKSPVAGDRLWGHRGVPWAREENAARISKAGVPQEPAEPTLLRSGGLWGEPPPTAP